MALGVSTDIFTVLVLLEILIGSYRSGQRSLEGASIVGIGSLILAMTVAYEMLVGYQAGETLDLSAVIDMFRKAGTKSPQEIVDLSSLSLLLRIV